MHRDARSFDESADLVTLAHTPVVVVCAGEVHSDVGATLERLETLGARWVRTTRFPGFFITDSGHDLPWSLESPEQVAAVVHAQRQQGISRAALVLANPVPPDEQLDPAWHDRVLAEGLAELAAQRISGKEVTPYLLAHFHRVTGGASLAVNVRIILRRLAAQIAVALAASGAATAHRPAAGSP